MKVGILYTRVVTRKLQGGGGGVQFLLLGGFSSKLTEATSSYYETLSPGSVLKQAEIDRKVAVMQQHGNALEVKDVTDSGTAKKLAKLFGDVTASTELPVAATFAAMPIGTYL